MSGENLNANFDHDQQTQFSAGSIPQVPSSKNPRKKRIARSLIRHQRNINADIALAKADANRKVYERVFLSYCDLRGTAPIGAFNMDPLARGNGLSFSAVEFMVDVDKCVAATLRSYEREKFYQLIEIELQDLSDESRIEAYAAIGVTPVLMGRLTQRLGRSFFFRGLDPAEYFKTIKRRKFDEQSRVRIADAALVENHEDALSAAQVQQSADFDAGDFETGYTFGQIEPQSYE